MCLANEATVVTMSCKVIVGLKTILYMSIKKHKHPLRKSQDMIFHSSSEKIK